MWSGIILAGGPNRQMGGTLKSLLRFGGETLIEHQVREMRSVCSEIIVVTDDPSPLLRILDRNVRIITDYYDGQGPLAGIHAGLKLATLQQAWVVGCDMPYLSAKAAVVLREMLRQGGQAVVPNVNGGVYPLHGLYDRSCADAAEELVKRGETSASALLRNVAWQEAREDTFMNEGIPLTFVVNINTMNDYERVRIQWEQQTELERYEAKKQV